MPIWEDDENGRYSRRLSQALQDLEDLKKNARRDKAYISELENYILQTQQHIAALEQR